MKRFVSFMAAFSIASLLFAYTSGEIIDMMDGKMKFGSAYFSAELVNSDKFGKTTLEFDAYQRENGDTLLTVLSGPDRGQKILRLDDEIYIYYPDADETIRLSSSGLKDSFLGSDFSYEDLTGDDDYDRRYTHTLEGEEEIDGMAAYVLSLTAKKRSETYQKEIIYVDEKSMVPVRMDLFSLSGKLLKTVLYSSYIVEGDTYFPGRIEVINAVRKNSVSVMSVKSLETDIEIDGRMFESEEMAW